MSDFKGRHENEIFTKVLKAGRRTYFFDVRETKAGDYYLTITESKKNFGENGEVSFEKHKIYLYKEDFSQFGEMFTEATKFIIDEKGEDVISERHEKNFKKPSFTINSEDEV
ncbi:MAG: DNA-binding protein [Flavobacteriales bacterium]|nr:MAG: DNA-binding protein [Flavobacteriales bacterium]